MFKKVEGHAFQLEHCWRIMRFQQKWMDEHQRIMLVICEKSSIHLSEIINVKCENY